MADPTGYVYYWHPIPPPDRYGHVSKKMWKLLTRGMKPGVGRIYLNREWRSWLQGVADSSGPKLRADAECLLEALNRHAHIEVVRNP